jgi:hypothetical protein
MQMTMKQHKWVGLKFGGHLVHNVDFIVIKNIGDFSSMMIYC